ncbi:hypothetical protein BIV23_08055 [Streptomyces monashensis]|uniref:Uncharacterized protein n=1 Tax=Streptomyces monashensis TaxID=1678012 RepID=A0A1S2QLK8_9ACTN|nr:hypothetical protein BIV23_08055 [Streptomyces monashensis]
MPRRSPEHLTPDLLAPPRFLPALGAVFDTLTPWERRVRTLQTAPRTATVPHGVTAARRHGPGTP